MKRIRLLCVLAATALVMLTLVSCRSRGGQIQFGGESGEGTPIIIEPTTDDIDGDGILDDYDNCRTVPNRDQADADGDGVGDACDKVLGPTQPGDQDSDGVPDTADNCPADYNPNQLDTDGDGVGDVCDNCPNDSNADQTDINGDGIGDACHPLDPQACLNVDTDGDGCNDCAVTGNVPTPSNDGPDADNDGLCDVGDPCPNDPNPNCTDVVLDNCPSDPNKMEPGICGCGVPETGDTDRDGIADCIDPFTVMAVKIVLPNPNVPEIILAALPESNENIHKIHRYAKIRVLYEGTRPAGEDPQLLQGFTDVPLAIESESAGVMLLKPVNSSGRHIPLRNLTLYKFSLAGRRYDFKVKAPGDINADGYSEVVIGSPAEASGTIAGRVLISFNTASSSSIVFSDPNLGKKFGSAVAVGDVNGDGIDDIVVGMLSWANGHVYVFNGPIEKGEALSENDANAHLWRFGGPFSGFGAALALGDYNGDGFDELAIGEPDASDYDNSFTSQDKKEGVVNLFYGGPAGIITRSVNYSSTPNKKADLAFRLNSASPGQQVGYSLAFMDVNDDALEDLIIGAPGHDRDTAAGITNCIAGRVYVRHGSTTVFTPGTRSLLDNLPAAQQYEGPSSSLDPACNAMMTDGFGKSVSAGSEGIIYIGTAKSKAYSAANGALTDLGLALHNVVDPMTRHDVVAADIPGGVAVGIPAANTFAFKGKGTQTWHVVTRNANTKLGSAVAAIGDYDKDGNLDYAVGEERYTSQMLFGRVLINLDEQGAEGTIENDTPSIVQFGSAIAPAPVK